LSRELLTDRFLEKKNHPRRRMLLQLIKIDMGVQ
jgi:hypothetical protein